MRKGGRRVGFTLSELLVVIAILAVVLGLAVASLGGMRKQGAVTASANAVAAMIRLARNRAISENRVFHVRFSNVSLANPWERQQVGVYLFLDGGNFSLAAALAKAKQSDLADGEWDDATKCRRVGGQRLEPQVWLYCAPQSLSVAEQNTELSRLTVPEEEKFVFCVPERREDGGRLLFFYPDGSASGNFDVYVRLEPFFRRISVRQATGLVAVSAEVASP